MCIRGDQTFGEKHTRVVYGGKKKIGLLPRLSFENGLNLLTEVP